MLRERQHGDAMGLRTCSGLVSAMLVITGVLDLPRGNVASAQAPPTIKVTTRLIQLGVVAHDKQGKPIVGLRKDDFTVLDNGVPQQISFFSASVLAHGVPHSLPANFFTNRSDLKGENPAATIVVLFDSLNTAFEDQSFMRKQALQFLETVKPQDRVALFGLTTELLVLHDFTEDAQALANSVNRFSPKLLAAFDASHPEPFHVPGLADDPMFRTFENRVNGANQAIADGSTTDRIRITYGALVAIANYVDKIPGRKSLVWVTGGIPMHVGAGRIGVPDRDHFSLSGPGVPGLSSGEDMEALTRALNRVNMAVYPIDVHGLDIDDRPAAFFAREAVRDTFRTIADETGGKAFYGTNDVAGAIDSAFEDGRYTYTLGFYPNHGQWNGEFRKISVKVSANGAHLRYRHGYFALQEKSEPDAVMKTDLQEAAGSPLDVTDLSVSVKEKVVGPLSAHLLQIQVILDPKQLLILEEQGHWRGGLDLLFLQSNGGGSVLAAEKQHFEVNFGEQEYQYLSKVGLVLQRRLKIETGAVAVRVLVRDAGSGALGSVTFPLGKS